jgi:hypothetical protein
MIISPFHELDLSVWEERLMSTERVQRILRLIEEAQLQAHVRGRAAIVIDSLSLYEELSLKLVIEEYPADMVKPRQAEYWTPKPVSKTLYRAQVRQSFRAQMRSVNRNR